MLNIEQKIEEAQSELDRLDVDINLMKLTRRAMVKSLKAWQEVKELRDSGQSAGTGDEEDETAGGYGQDETAQSQ
jgi:hypothetical protein